ncbi:hypothetical protein O0I10_012059 [Lichtheimia ornata]|uniref:Uncharacterized protein n=1 Tax=Lichtheimia ornata TaxID=688661 RepID=A0AAD7USG4_9FUNG|nr:uncharacterized protein O0I10_012059 [Lichtheimia ornata]KAJ8652333.1 hypothetical protein O0I10_012059 [Lichtheimia ornata]
MISQLRRLSLDTNTKTKASSKRKKSLSVRISKEPPVIHKFEQDNLECSFECIYDPEVLHDSEEDHADLLFHDGKKRLCKPWEAHSCVEEQQSNNMSGVFKRLTTWTPTRMGRSSTSSQDIPAAISPV